MLIVEMIAKIRRAFFVQGKPIKAIAAASKKDGHKLRAVIENLVLSELFKKR